MTPEGIGMTEEGLRMTPGTIRSLQVCSGLCAQLLRESLSKETLASLWAVRDLLLEPPFSELAPEPARVIFGVLDQVTLGDASADTLLTALRQDYTYLFYMVGQSHTSPYESSYRTEDHTLFGPTTFELRQLMADFGVSRPPDSKDPDDHLALELAFLSQLLVWLAEEEPEDGPGDDPDGGVEKAARLVQGIRTLLADHLLGFGPIYLTQLSQVAKTPFYQAVAQLSLATLDAAARTFAVNATYEVLS